MRVVIVGAGLSGLSLAALLRRLHAGCIMLDQAPFLRPNSVVPYTLFAKALCCYRVFGTNYIFTQSGAQSGEAFGARDATGRWLLGIKNKRVALESLGAEDVIPLSTNS